MAQLKGEGLKVGFDLRQSVYSPLAGYEDVNDATRMSKDPGMRVVIGKKKAKKEASFFSSFDQLNS